MSDNLEKNNTQEITYEPFSFLPEYRGDQIREALASDEGFIGLIDRNNDEVVPILMQLCAWNMDGEVLDTFGKLLDQLSDFRTMITAQKIAIAVDSVYLYSVKTETVEAVVKKMIRLYVMAGRQIELNSPLTIDDEVLITDLLLKVERVQRKVSTPVDKFIV